MVLGDDKKGHEAENRGGIVRDINRRLGGMVRIGKHARSKKRRREIWETRREVSRGSY